MPLKIDLRRYLSSFILLSVLLVFVIVLTPGKAMAATDTFEPNDTWESAWSITSNQTVHSYIYKSGDADWYSVYLYSSFDNTITLQADSGIVEVDFDLYDPSNPNTPVLSSDTLPSNAIKKLRFRPAVGNFYKLRIKPRNPLNYSSTFGYTLKVGDPIYLTSSYSTYLPNSTEYLYITRSYSYSETRNLDLTNVTTLPRTATVTKVAIGGNQSGSATGRIRSVKPASSTSWINCPEFLFESNSIAAGTISLRQQWQFRHYISTLSGTSYGLRPQIIFYYRYEVGD